MKKVGIVANHRKAQAAEVLERVVTFANTLGLDLVADETTAGLLNDASRLPVSSFEGVDAVVTVGGDGTMLRVARELGESDRPIMGINIGKLGFLTCADEDDMERAIESLAHDTAISSETAIADTAVSRGDEEISHYYAVNDVVISGGAAGRITELDLTIDGETVTTYVCDGLIVSTPAGSTGHSLSAGGPILVPETRAFVVSLICPHTLSSRPLVVPDRSRIAVTAKHEEGAMLSLDGQITEELRQDDVVTVTRAERSVRFLYLPGHNYYSILRHKLHWSGSSV